MNLIDLVRRKDKVLESGNDLQVTFVNWLGESWRSLRVEANKSPQIVITGISRVTSLKGRPFASGWYVSCEKASSFLKIILETDGEVISKNIELGSIPVPVTIPWPFDDRLLNKNTKLKLHFDLPTGSNASLLVHRKLDRKHLIAFAQGHGVELGPGSNPQILNSDITKVSYIEETSQEEWIKLYDGTGKRKAKEADFSDYIIGNAWDIPCEDDSLDFIFSSHVFEHLANPLGHLVRWHKKLKAGGTILAVVPELHSTKDREANPSTLDEIKNEFKEGIQSPTVEHYSCWVGLRGSNYNVEDLMHSKTSIHVHYYDPVNLSMLLQECVKEYGFSSYSIIHSQNHKDFHYCLRK